MRWGFIACVLWGACVRSNPNAGGELPDESVAVDLATPVTVDLAKPNSVDDLAMAPVEAGTLVHPDLGGADLAGIDLAGSDFATGADMALVVVCGDNRCDRGEDCITCMGDCGACVCEAKRASCDGVPGCEVDVNAADEGEPEDDVCSGKNNLGNLDEGMQITVGNHRLLGAGDVDTYTVLLREGTHICAGGAQPYTMVATVAGPGGTKLSMRLASNAPVCNDSWTNTAPTGICLSWSGTCFVNDQLQASFQVLGASSCDPYTLHVKYCALGTTPCCTDEGCCN